LNPSTNQQFIISHLFYLYVFADGKNVQNVHFCIKIFERKYNIITKDGKSGNRKFKRAKFKVIRMPIIKSFNSKKLFDKRFV